MKNIMIWYHYCKIFFYLFLFLCVFYKPKYHICTNLHEQSFGSEYKSISNLVKGEDKESMSNPLAQNMAVNLNVLKLVLSRKT